MAVHNHGCDMVIQQRVEVIKTDGLVLSYPI